MMEVTYAFFNNKNNQELTVYYNGEFNKLDFIEYLFQAYGTTKYEKIESSNEKSTIRIKLRPL